MGRTAIAVAVSLILFPVVLRADPVADDNARLRQEVQDLKARNDALQRMCVSAAGKGAAASPVTAAASAPAAPLSVPAPAAAAAPATTAVVTPPAVAPSPTATTTATPAYAPMPAPAGEPAAPPSNPYGSTGCDRGFLKGPEQGPWQKAVNWRKFSRGASMREVESALGVEHFDVHERNGDTKWEYGSCGSTWEGAVIFDDGDKVVSISPPDR